MSRTKVGRGGGGVSWGATRPSLIRTQWFLTTIEALIVQLNSVSLLVNTHLCSLFCFLTRIGGLGVTERGCWLNVVHVYVSLVGRASMY